jgi:hypothetical protein
MGLTEHTDMRIVPFGSGGSFLDLDWFLNSRDIKLFRQASELEIKDYLFIANILVLV